MWSFLPTTGRFGKCVVSDYLLGRAPAQPYPRAMLETYGGGLQLDKAPSVVVRDHSWGRSLSTQHVWPFRRIDSEGQVLWEKYMAAHTHLHQFFQPEEFIYLLDGSLWGVLHLTKQCFLTIEFYYSIICISSVYKGNFLSSRTLCHFLQYK